MFGYIRNLSSMSLVLHYALKPFLSQLPGAFHTIFNKNFQNVKCRQRENFKFNKNFEYSIDISE